MSSLPEIEAATESLSDAAKQELLLFLATCLREQMGALIAKDEADLDRGG